MTETQEIRVPRPRNEWIIFLSDFCEEMKGRLAPGERASQAASKRWDAMTEAQKAVYVRKAKVELQEHQMKYPGYVYKPMRAGSGSGSCKKSGKRTSKMERVKEAQINGKTHTASVSSRASSVLSELDSILHLSPSPDLTSPALQRQSSSFMDTFTPVDFSTSEPNVDDASSSLPLTPIIPSPAYSPSMPAYNVNATLFSAANNVEHWDQNTQYFDDPTAPEYYFVQEPVYPTLQLDENHVLSQVDATQLPMSNDSVEYWIEDPRSPEDPTAPEYDVNEEPSYPTLQLDENHLLSQYENNPDDTIPQDFRRQALEPNSYNQDPPYSINFPSLGDFDFDLGALDIPPFSDGDPSAPFEFNVGVPFSIAEWLSESDAYSCA
ncbi:slightly ste11-like protein [Marasmius crinis-equi]|uniref:Slightly ste11-like protein n=1 Tax=Marasmius crinis-equi TaxID=585013 RepID=A0ABR3F8Z3_9AGAR